jgi:hypothetical protein
MAVFWDKAPGSQADPDGHFKELTASVIRVMPSKIFLNVRQYLPGCITLHSGRHPSSASQLFKNK